MPPPPPLPPPSQPQPPTKENKKITVYLTGFGSFARVASNPSWAIVASFLGENGDIDGDTKLELTTIPGYTIVFRPHPEAVRVAYATADALVPELWAVQGVEWDYILHIGVGLEGGFQLETQAWEGGYKLKDVDGCVPVGGGCGNGRDDGCRGGGEKAERKAQGEVEVVEVEGVEVTRVHGSENPAANQGEGKLLKTALDVPWIVDLVATSVTVCRPSPLFPLHHYYYYNDYHHHHCPIES